LQFDKWAHLFIKDPSLKEGLRAGGTTGEALTKGPLGDGEVGKWGRKGKVKREPPNQIK